VILFLWMTGSLGDYFLATRFDAAAWRAHANAAFDDRTRLRMVEDLRESGRLEGLTRAEVVGLLGEPSERGRRDTELVWRVGPDRGFGIDSTWLSVEFGSDGRVRSHWLWQD
jgi:hypothetical protein